MYWGDTMKKRLLLVSLVAAAALLSGCAAVEKLLGIGPHTALRKLQVVAPLGANQNTATAMDVVFVYDSTAQATLPKTGPEWFAAKQALLAGLALSVDVVSLQIPPGSALQEVALPKNYYYKSVAVYSYVNYLSPAGQPLGNLTPFKCALVTLGPSAVAYQPCQE